MARLTSRKSYLIIICTNSYDKLLKSEISSSILESVRTWLSITRPAHMVIIIWSLFDQNKSSCIRFEHCSEPIVQPICTSYLVIICPNSHAKLTKSKLGQVGFGSNIAQNHSFNPLEVILVYIWLLFAQIHRKSWDQKWN